MTDLDLPIVTPKKVLEKRGIQERIYNADTAIICFRGRKASNQLIKRFDGKPTKKRVLYHPQLYYSSEFNLFIVPELIWGGPVTAIVIEELFTLGVRKLVGFGAAGSINPVVQPGAIFVPKKAICSDGTSKEYTDKTKCSPDLELLDFYKDRTKKFGILFLTGLTTDGLYRETPRKIKKWRELGADFINMEISPFYVVSDVLGIKAIYVGLITDYVGENWDYKYWGIENEVDIKIIESIRELKESTALTSLAS